VLWLHIVTCRACVPCTVWGYTLTQCTIHTPHRSQYAAITLTTSCTSSMYPLWTTCVILAKYCLWLPEACVPCTVWGYYTLTQCTVHTPHSSQYAAITLTTSCTSSMYPLWTKCVILAKYWLWLPEACVPCTVWGYILYLHTVHDTHASQVTICSHSTDNVLYELYVSTLNDVCNFS